jgi:hypothetical protein
MYVGVQQGRAALYLLKRVDGVVGGVFIWGLARLDAAKVAHTARLRLTTNAAFQSAL